MAAITMNSAVLQPRGVQFLENVTITNQSENSTAVTKGLSVPDWARKVIFTIFFDSSGGHFTAV